MKKNILKRITAMALVATLIYVPSFKLRAENTIAAPNLTVQQMLEKPSNSITKAEFARMINTYLDLQPKEGVEGFNDVPTDSPYAQDLQCAKQIGYYTGDSQGNVHPDSVISAAEAIVAVNKLLGFDLSKVNTDTSLDTPAWAKPAASNLIDLTIISKEFAQKKQLTVEDADELVTALSVAMMYSDSPYALKQASPKDDFYNYYNRQFLATAVAPSGYPYPSSFQEAAVNVDGQVGKILNGILQSKNLVPNSTEWKIKQIHNMYMDNDARTKSIQKLNPIFEDIRNAQSVDELKNVYIKYNKNFNLQNLYDMSPGSDAKVDARKWAAFYEYGSLGLGLKDYYEDDSNLAEIQNTYKKYVASLLSYIGETENVNARAEAYFNLEKSLANKRIDSAQASNIDVAYTPTTWAEMGQITKNLKIETLDPVFFDIAKNFNVYCGDQNYIKFADGLFVNDHLQVLKDMALLNAISQTGAFVGDDLSHLSDDINMAITGTSTSDTPIEQRAQAVTRAVMSKEFSKLYADKYASKKLKEDITLLVEKIRSKRIEKIEALDWMSKETKDKAIDKLKSIKANLVYPDVYSEPMDFDLVSKEDGGTLLDMYFKVSEKEHDTSIEALKKPYGNNLWDFCPTDTVNAFYSPSDNAIIIPAGILQAPFYSEDWTEAQNLGGIGVVIGHEFTHAFDNTGAKFDKNGTMTNWWTAEDYAAFGKRTTEVATKLSDIQFTLNKNVNGELCTGEAVADLGGLSCAIAIAEDENLDLSQLMTSYAGLWAARIPLQYVEYLIAADVHGPAKVRVNFTLAQQEAFYKIFNIQPNDKMYVAPEDRINIW